MRWVLFILVAAFVLASCKKKSRLQAGEVYIKEEGNRYVLFRHGKPFFIKGAAGFEELKTLNECGGNTIRTWDTVNISSILDEAQKNGLAVVVGLPMPSSTFNRDFYDDSAKTNLQIKAFEGLIRKYKNHPALLMWCVGNELEFSYEFYFNSFYSQFNRIVDLIHKVDANHPVTTTIANFRRKFILNVALRCDLDLLSFNIFSKIETMDDDMKKFSWFWKGPFIITEWGSNGPWEEVENTSWGAPIEATSTKKAERILARYHKYMPLNNQRFLGAFVFYWGHKQEVTPTWFSLFDADGRRSETVDVMAAIWKNKSERPGLAPEINYMLVDGLGARDNIILTASSTVSAEIKLVSDMKVDSVKWEIIQEDWFKKNNSNNQTFLRAEKGLIPANSGLKMLFKTPEREGPYRIYATIYDRSSRYSVCNTPIYIMKK